MTKAFRRDEFTTQFGAWKFLFLKQQNPRTVQRHPDGCASACRTSTGDRNIKCV
jgi:hypothetical protein